MILENNESIIRYSPTETSPPILAEKISDMGFPTKIKEVCATDLRNDYWEEAVIDVQGMTCMSCVKNIQGKISKEIGIQSIVVSLERNEAVVKFNSAQTTAKDIAEAIDDMGFEAKVKPRQKNLIARIRVEGMTCQSCVKNIEGNISTKAGVKEIKVSLSDKEAVIIYDPVQTNPEILREQIDDMGFEAIIPRESSIELEFDRLASRQSSSRSVMREAECTISIKGMTCNSCVKNIESNITGRPGIKSIKVFLEKENGVVKYDPNITSPDTIADMIDDMGFEAVAIPNGGNSDTGTKGETQTCMVRIEGMTCNSCVKTIEGKMGDNPGVVKISVSLADSSGKIEYLPNKVTPTMLCEAIEDMGFDASVMGKVLAVKKLLRILWYNVLLNFFERSITIYCSINNNK